MKLRAFKMVWVTDLIYKYIFPPIDKKQEGIIIHEKIEKLLNEIKKNANQMESINHILSLDQDNSDRDEEKLKMILLNKVFKNSLNEHTQGKAEQDVTKQVLEVEYNVKSKKPIITGKIDAVFSLKNNDGQFDGKNLAIYDWKLVSEEDIGYIKRDLRNKREQKELFKDVTKISYDNIYKVQLNLYRILYKNQKKLKEDVNIRMIQFHITPTFNTIIEEIDIMEEVDSFIKKFENQQLWDEFMGGSGSSVLESGGSGSNVLESGGSGSNVLEYGGSGPNTKNTRARKQYPFWKHIKKNKKLKRTEMVENK